MGGGLSETNDQVRRAQDPEEAAIPGEHRADGTGYPAPLATDSSEVPGPEAGCRNQRFCRANPIRRTAIASGAATGWGRLAGDARRDDNGMREAGAERRNGFAARGKL
jgi:hypothetical protein